MVHTSEPGATAHSATMSRLIRWSPVTARPSRVSPHAAASPAAIVTVSAAPSAPTPGIQDSVSMAAGYPGNQAKMTSRRRLPGT